MLKSAVVIALGLALSACAGQSGYLRQAGAANGAPLGAPTVADLSPAVDAQAYTIGALDLLQVRVLGFPELNTEAQVDLSGRIELPLVGTVTAAGLSPTDLSRQLTESYERTYLRRATVSVSIKEIKSRFISIEGDVKRAGLFPLPTNLSLSRAIALAEGPGEFATLDRVAIFRQVDGRQMAAVFDVQDIRLGKYADPPIYANDVIVVGGSSVRRAFREIVQIAPFIAVFRPFG